MHERQKKKVFSSSSSSYACQDFVPVLHRRRLQQRQDGWIFKQKKRGRQKREREALSLWRESLIRTSVIVRGCYFKNLTLLPLLSVCRTRCAVKRKKEERDSRRRRGPQIPAAIRFSLCVTHIFFSPPLTRHSNDLCIHLQPLDPVQRIRSLPHPLFQFDHQIHRYSSWLVSFALIAFRNTISLFQRIVKKRSVSLFPSLITKFGRRSRQHERKERTFLFDSRIVFVFGRVSTKTNNEARTKETDN